MVTIVRRLPVSLYACALLAACGGGGGTDTPVASTRPVSQSDIEIAQALYSDSARTPPGFYSESLSPSSGTVAITHVKSADLVQNISVPQYELCSDDWSQAYDWSEQAVQGSTQYGSLLTADDTDRFYEFVRARTGTPAGELRERVYRCSYLDRGSVDLRAAYTHAGQLNRRPISAATLRELSEYLWLFTSYNNYGNAVLQSADGSSGGNLQHTLYMASLVSSGGGNGCDRIDVQAWTHTVDTQSGELTLSKTLLWSFDAKRIGGLAQLCAN